MPGIVAVWALTGSGCRREPAALGTAIEKYFFGVIAKDPLARSRHECLIALCGETQNVWAVHRLSPRDREGALPKDLGLRFQIRSTPGLLERPDQTAVCEALARRHTG
jgi:hypothetical protein